MNLSDLRIFLSAAQQPSLGAAALEMHLTTSAVSKALKRLEEHVGTALFDRSARQLALNSSGRMLVQRAQTLLALADQARCDLQGERASVDCRVGGPAILLWRHGVALSDALRAWPEASLRLHALYEDEALAALERGEIGAALVTGDVVQGRGEHWSEEWEATPLGTLSLRLVAGRSHPLAAELAAAGSAGADQAAVLVTDSARVLAHDFVCPSQSPFCGARRGSRSDGWRDDQLPRRIRYWADDLQLLLALVKAGQALAYLPDFALADPDLRRIRVSDCPFHCEESVYLVWKRKHAAAWLQALAQQLAGAAA
ncbi:LysR family transcriptional regulator [Pseudoduganella violacea]|uniref:DNA-binding transcriptional LysR family regulator n=1 Tax=Pseudoduganella violacea TaxID=1715466 RepID=A0A7W5FTS5_9BURK|nr:LysR family transcriptional regulator [Pseudoduganella violacea]MBB3119089.1 DNA-binding transcriptional LysR family regulator [Pseudoduganella violacea]